MLDPFTPIKTVTDPFGLTFINEIIGAYSERRQALGEEEVTVAAGDDAHEVDYWKAIQEWIEVNALNYIDHTQAVAGNFDGLAAIPMWILADFRTEAGLASGFRRATEWTPDPDNPDWEVDVDFSYGQAQLGDIFGPWIFEDLQKAFSTLRWTLQNAKTSGTKQSTQGLYSGGNCATALSTAQANWILDLPLWGGGAPGGTNRIAQGYAHLYSGGMFYTAMGFRQRHRVDLTLPGTVTTVVPAAVGIHYAVAESHRSGLGLSDTFEDFDGYGFADNTFHFWEEYPEDPLKPVARGGAAEATYAGVLNTGGASADPLVQDPPKMECGSKEGRYGWGFENFDAVVKWSFTNQG